MATISERLRELSGAMLAADIDMRLPEGSIDPDEAADTIDALVAALERQADNVAFMLNRFELPRQWHEKLDRELAEDRAALSRAKG